MRASFFALPVAPTTDCEGNHFGRVERVELGRQDGPSRSDFGSPKCVIAPAPQLTDGRSDAELFIGRFEPECRECGPIPQSLEPLEKTVASRVINQLSNPLDTRKVEFDPAKR